MPKLRLFCCRSFVTFADALAKYRSLSLNRSSGIRTKLRPLIRPKLRLRPKQKKSAPIDHWANPSLDLSGRTDANVGGFSADIFGRISADNLSVASDKLWPTIFARNSSHFQPWPRFGHFRQKWPFRSKWPNFGFGRFSANFLAEFRCRPKPKSLCRSLST